MSSHQADDLRLGNSDFMARWAATAQELARESGRDIENTDGLVALFLAFLRMHAQLGIFSFGPLTISLAVVEELAGRQLWGGEGDYRAFTQLLHEEMKRSNRPLDEVSALLALMKVRRGLPGHVFGELGVSPAAIEAYVSTGKLPQPELERLYSPEDAAEYLGVHVGTIRNWIRSGRLPASRLAGERAIRIRASDLLATLEPIEPTAPPD